jgi:hypothetical protein
MLAEKGGVIQGMADPPDGIPLLCSSKIAIKPILMAYNFNTALTTEQEHRILQRSDKDQILHRRAMSQCHLLHPYIRSGSVTPVLAEGGVETCRFRASVRAPLNLPRFCRVSSSSAPAASNSFTASPTLRLLKPILWAALKAGYELHSTSCCVPFRFRVRYSQFHLSAIVKAPDPTSSTKLSPELAGLLARG